MLSTTPVKRPSNAKMRPAEGQSKTLVFVRQFFAKYKRMPVFAEIAGGVGVSESAIRQSVKRLERRGLLKRDRTTRYGNLGITRNGTSTALKLERGELEVI